MAAQANQEDDRYLVKDNEVNVIKLEIPDNVVLPGQPDDWAPPTPKKSKENPIFQHWTILEA